MPGLSTLASSRGQKRGRLLIGVVHGTSTGGVSRSKGTHLPLLIKFIDHENEDVVNLTAAGVGTNGSFSDKFAGLLGIGHHTIVVMVYKDIADNYREGNDDRACDRILLSGYSRGGDAAIKVAKLINAVGLVVGGDDEIYRALYKLLATEGEWSEEAIKKVKSDKYKWIGNVSIAELLVFDVVSTLGVPATGIGRMLKLFPAWSKNKEHMIVVPANVQHTSHAIILHDPRAPFEHSTLCIPENSNQVLRQKYFPGRHSDSMNIGPMAFQVQNLAADLELQFIQANLDAYFPDINAEKLVPDWVFSDIEPVSTRMLTLLGSKPRIPGRYTHPGFVTNEEISSSLRHRGYGTVVGDNNPVESFFCTSDPRTGRPSWVHNRTTNRTNKSSGSGSGSGSGSDDFDAPLRLPEAKDGDLERLLSGLPEN